jgi:catechol 2,3-dioxygenase-like lactoylglutathione lyase family enzyme
MQVTSLIPQLRTTDLQASINFYVNKLGFELDFQYSDFYAGIKIANQFLHLKLIDDPDPSIEFVQAGDHLHLFLPTDDVAGDAERVQQAGIDLFKAVEDTPWGSREFYIKDNQGHILVFSQGLEENPA